MCKDLKFPETLQWVPAGNYVSASLLVFPQMQTANSENMIPLGIPNDVRADASTLTMGL